MFTSIKRKLMLFFFNQQKKKAPFNTETLELFQLPKDEHYDINNSYFFGCNHPDKEQSLILRLGCRNAPMWEIFLYWRTADTYLKWEGDKCPKGDNCPLKLKCLVLGETWSVSFSGQLIDQQKQPHAVEFEYQFKATQPIYDFFYHSDGYSMANAIANAKWNKQFFQLLDSQGRQPGVPPTKNKRQRHTEQNGHATGYIIVDGHRTELDLPCLRDHSIGTRVWGFMDNHIWLSAITAKGEVFNLSMVNYPYIKRICMGYSNINRTTPAHNLISYQLHGYDHLNGVGPDALEADVTFTGGVTHHVKCRRLVNDYVPYDNGDYYFQEAIGEFDIDGVKALGTIEYGYNRDSSRWEGFDMPQ